ncbi:MAG: DCC1-like thiol-disulfide oxidoreductase family protein [Candidatus Obscuribacterales bacterium]|nr:DCC1-like thiol-disulfide oxidoreductase family protein [Candidatus Obscuribacterales bacterium]
MTMTTQCTQEALSFTIVCDERCSVVRSLAAVLRVWDYRRHFIFIDRQSQDRLDEKLISDLDESRWSLFLIDEQNDRWYGPDAIPIILKNLPFGKCACVFYILPGTMALTRAAYAIISQSRQLLKKKLEAA